jgi:tRNA nucleotidyltransferase/poly(A) polymerase
MKKLFNYKLQTLKNSDFIQAVINSNWKPYLVGGCVRDYLINIIPKDIDIIIVGCDKPELIELLNKYGHCDLVGESFAVIKYLYKNEIYDISTPRTEKKVDVGHKGFEVISNKNISLELDLLRRDLTINSIAMDFDGNFIDPFHGINDIKNKNIKVTNSNAFTDDPLRIVRCIRFASRLNFNIDKTTFNLISATKNKIPELSHERIIEEWTKVLNNSKNDLSIMQRYVDLLTKLNLWEYMFPGLSIKAGKIKSSYNSIIWENLIVEDDIDNLRKIMLDLKFPIYLYNEILFLRELLLMDIAKVYKLAKLYKRFNISNNLIMEFSKIKNLDKRLIDSFLKYCENGFTIDGNDLINQGFKGSDIEKEKERREIEKFKNDYLL